MGHTCMYNISAAATGSRWQSIAVWCHGVLGGNFEYKRLTIGRVGWAGTQTLVGEKRICCCLELGFILAHQNYLHHHQPSRSHSYYDHHLKRNQLGQLWVKWNWGEVIEVNSCALLMEISGSRIRNRITLTYKINRKVQQEDTDIIWNP